MASKTIKTPFLHVLKRKFAVQAKPASCAATDLKVSTLPNKMVVISADCNNQGLVKVCVAVKAGSRYEHHESFGVSHVVRSSTGLSTVSASKFNIMRNLQQLGSSLSATSDRETIVYTLETTCNNLMNSLKYLRYVTCEPCFKPWELSDNIPRMEYELASVPPLGTLMDDLHKAAYRTGLGNSIFAKGYRLKSIGSETVQDFVNKTFLSNRTAVSGVGIDHELLEEFSNGLTLSSGPGESVPSKYHGGELRHEANIGMTHVAIASESVGMMKKDVYSYAILRSVLGGTSSVKWGVGSSPLAKAFDQTKGPIAAQAFHAAHSDSGLFGVVISAKPNHIKEGVETAMKTLQGGIKDEDIERGKKNLISEILYDGEKCRTLAEDLAIQGVIVGGANSPRQLAEAVAQVPAAQVQEAYKNVMKGPKTLACLGAVHNVPYLEEI